MQKNWYILYTKPGFEKKVSALLTKRKVENFYAINVRKALNQRKEKKITIPLFPSFLFVYTTREQIKFFKEIEYVINLIYWANKPAIIPEEEIRTIKEFTESYENICTEKIKRRGMDSTQNSHIELFSELEGKVLILKNRILKVNLPSLGYTMSVSVERPGIIISNDAKRLEGNVSLQ